MSVMKRCFLAGVLLVLLAACNGGSEYIALDNVVVYKYWTFSFGTRYDTLPGADPASFKQVKPWLGHDNERVYYEHDLVPDVDVATLEAVREPLFRDKNDYFYCTKPLHVADMASFKIIKWQGNDFWARDSRYAYFNANRFEVDIQSFKVISYAIAKDKNHVYFFSEVIPDADPATFKPIGNSIYYRDKSHIWCGDVLLEDADYDTFEADDLDTAHDKFGRFRMEKRDTVADL